MKDARIWLVTALVFFLLAGAAWYQGRSSVQCPEPITTWEALRALQAKAARTDSLDALMTTILSAAEDAHKEHVNEIVHRPQPSFDDYFTNSPDRAAARAKWDSILMRRPARYDYRTDSAGHLLSPDTVR